MDFFACIADIGKGIVDGGANFGKGMVLGRIEVEFRQMSEEWIRRWARGEVFFLEDYIIPCYGKQLPQYQNIVIPLVDSISSQELRQCAMNARPELMHIWDSQEAINRIDSEKIRIIDYISRL